MTGWPAVAGTHVFVVRGQENARALAEALADYGFPLVNGQPESGDSWLVTALDEGPYPADIAGHRGIDAVGRQAALLARQHGGYLRGGSRCDPGMLGLYEVDSPITVRNPGARPPVPAVVITPAPPRMALASTPDVISEAVVDFSGLAEIDWADLDHAEAVPGLLLALTENTEDWPEIFDELVGDGILHQGTCYPATAPAMTFLARLAASGTLPASRRIELLMCLLYAADRWADSLLADADRAAVEARFPEAAPWTLDVHLAIGEEMPALLERWSAEPPLTRQALAGLAALYPEQGRSLTREIGAMAAEGTREAAYLRLAEALLEADDERVLAIVSDIAAWEESPDLGPLDVPGVTTALLGGHILASQSMPDPAPSGGSVQ